MKHIDEDLHYCKHCEERKYFLSAKNGKDYCETCDGEYSVSAEDICPNCETGYLEYKFWPFREENRWEYWCSEQCGYEKNKAVA